MEDFLELEEWLEDLDQNSKQKLDDQHSSGKGLEISTKTDDIDRHKPYEIDQQPPYLVGLHPPYAIDRLSPYIMDLHTLNYIDRNSPVALIDTHVWMNYQDIRLNQDRLRR
ncbi:hypothetical protein Bca52824_035440 [Brassica carinata]|uniref:Uncharacterized protein n=1 Tax=Brassica carinata TaxID=52824 RepID=A0A8X7S487_BRACI|nr:hypothetical protein Bca52824_035440 [Brassica carinata]